MKKKLTTTAMALTMALSLAACGGGGSNTATSGTSAGGQAATQTQTQAAGFTGDKYVSDKDGNIKTAEFPSGYTPLAYDKFVEGFKAVVDGKITTSSTYADVANAFGDDGIKLEGQKYEGYAYYAWFSDEDFAESKKGVLITFKDAGGNLTYYAYTGMGITADDVR